MSTSSETSFGDVESEIVRAICPVAEIWAVLVASRPEAGLLISKESSGFQFFNLRLCFRVSDAIEKSEADRNA